MQKWYFPHHIIRAETVCICLELFMINFSSKKYVKENKFAELVKIVFSKKVYRFLI
jgi:hypothetical protein